MGDHGLIFTTEIGTALDHDNVAKRLKATLKGLKLPDVPPYSLRHTAATLALEAGEDTTVVSRRLGHASTTITRDVYQHVSGKLDQRMTEKLIALYDG